MTTPRDPSTIFQRLVRILEALFFDVREIEVSKIGVGRRRVTDVVWSSAAGHAQSGPVRPVRNSRASCAYI